MDRSHTGAGSRPARDDAARHDDGFATLVAPLDESNAAERALPLAVHVARLERAPLVLVRVVPFPEPPAAAPSHGSSLICAADPPHEIADACSVLTGDPFTRIVAEIAHWPRPLVVLSAHAANAPSTGDRSELARRIASLPGIHVPIVPHENETGSPRPIPGCR